MSADKEGKFFIWDVSNELLHPRKMHQIVLSSSVDVINLSSVVQLKNAKNRFLVGTDVGNIKVVEVERIINDAKAGNLKPDKWSKTALGMLATLSKEVLYDCVADMQISFGPSRKIALEELNEQLLKMNPYDKILADSGLNCQYVNINVLDVTSTGLALINKSQRSIAVVDLTKKRILASVELDCESISKASFCLMEAKNIVTLTSDQELIFYEFEKNTMAAVKRVFNVVNYSLSAFDDKDRVLIALANNNLEIYESN